MLNCCNYLSVLIRWGEHFFYWSFSKRIWNIHYHFNTSYFLIRNVAQICQKISVFIKHFAVFISFLQLKFQQNRIPFSFHLPTTCVLIKYSKYSARRKISQCTFRWLLFGAPGYFESFSIEKCVLNLPPHFVNYSNLKSNFCCWIDY